MAKAMGTEGFERWNTHFSMCVEQEVMGRVLRLNQDPNSEHLGTTVWDASIVLAKYLEKHARRGDLSRPKVRGKRAIELGAGMGLGGMAFAMMGADVWLTDVKEVLPLLKANYEQNISPAACRACDGGRDLANAVGRVTVAELDWVNEDHRSAVKGPFDFILAADCIYHEHLLTHLYNTVVALSDSKTTIIIANERRSESVQSTFFDLFTPSFTFKKVPLSKMDPVHQHPAIELYLLKRKKAGASQAAADAASGEEAAGQLAADMEGLQLPCDTQQTGSGGGPGEGRGDGLPAASTSAQAPGEASSGGTGDAGSSSSQSGAVDSWQTRRQGVAAARLLAGVAVPAAPDPAR